MSSACWLTATWVSCSRTLSLRTRLIQHSAAITVNAPAADPAQRWSRSVNGAHSAAAHRAAATTADAAAAAFSGRPASQVFMWSPHPWVSRY